MNKSIFNLTREEGKKIDFEMKKTSYYKQYLIGYTLSLAILFLVGGGLLITYNSENEILNVLTLVIMCGFASILSLLFYFKRFNLVKQYYEEKVKKGE